MAVACGMSWRACVIASATCGVLLWPEAGLAQTGSGGHGADAGEAASYEQRYAELQGLQAAPSRVGPVKWLVLDRDVGRFTFESGTLHLLTPLGGRTVGAVFLGKGVFRFSPPSKIEQDRLVRFQKTRSLSVPFSSVVLLFADSTLQELESKLTFGAGQSSEDVRLRYKTALDHIGEQDNKSLHPDLMSAFLNNQPNGVFYAHVGATSGSPLIFMLNPREVESVSLGQRVRGYGWTRRSEVISQFPAGRQNRDGQGTGERPHDPAVRHYTISTVLSPTGSGDLSFAAKAELDITAPSAVGPWIAFSLFEKLRVDSARWDDGETATVWKRDDNGLLWVKLKQQMQAGESRKLQLHYRGDLIDREGDFFFIKSSAEWYPRPLEGRSLATFDLTFRSPKGKLLASVGDRVEFSTSGNTDISRWVSSSPIRNASFNLGFFKEYRVKEEGIPPVTVLLAEGMHRGVAMRQKNMKEAVGGDIAKSLRFFQHVYGVVPVKEFFATEIPYFHGEAFPGMINLSWSTFHQTDHEGMDEVFRAHEVAHQWWGIGVDFSTYHDQWLSEGFSTFSGLWYLQTVRKDNAKYFRLLHRWRDRILENREERAPIWLGYRTSSSKDESGYGVMVYNKGAWVLHMLRIMMLDLKTMNEDRFTGAMRDFYRTYEGKRASTDDFRRIAERHVGTDLGWFFDQWIYGTDVPSYRVAYRSEAAEGGQFRVKLQVHQDNVAEDFQMYVPVTLDLGGDRVARLRVKVRGAKSEIDLPLMPGKPEALRFNDLDGVLGQVKMVDWKD